MGAGERPTAIASLLDRCLDRVAGEPGAAAIWRSWDDAVGAQIARRAQPVRVRGRTLIVAVSSAPWMQELQLLKPALRAELNARLPTPLIDDVYFVLSDGADRAAALDRARPAPRCPRPPATPDLAALPDSLRSSFADLLAAWQRRAES